MGGSAHEWRGEISRDLLEGGELELTVTMTVAEEPDRRIGYEVGVDDGPPPLRPGRIELTRSSSRIVENAGPARIRVRRVEGTSGAVSVRVETEGITAEAGEDFTPVSGTLTWEAGEEGTRIIEVPVIDDGEVEPEERFRIRLRDPTGGASLGRRFTDVVIESEDLAAPGRLAFEDEAVVADEEAGEARVRVGRSGGASGAVSVSWSLDPLSATPGTDFEAVSGVLTWEDGETAPKSFSIPLFGDSEVERTELVKLVLSSPTGGAELGDRPVGVLVLRDDDRPTGCFEDPGHLCLGDRFRIEVEWRDPRSGDRGLGGAMPDSESTGFFWFFDAANIELIVKVLDGRGITGAYWVFFGGLSDVEFWVVATDTQTDAVRVYRNAPGSLRGVGDTRAFPEDPAQVTPGPAGEATSDEVRWGPLAVAPRTVAAPGTKGSAGSGPCVADATHLCLLDGRFRVGVEWRDPRSGDTGSGTAVPNSDPTGLFWFFSEDNLELVVKVLDATSFAGRFWVFYGSLTDVGYTITVEDLERGRIKEYVNPPGNLDGRADTDAFDAP